MTSRLQGVSFTAVLQLQPALWPRQSLKKDRSIVSGLAQVQMRPATAPPRCTCWSELNEAQGQTPVLEQNLTSIWKSYPYSFLSAACLKRYSMRQNYVT